VYIQVVVILLADAFTTPLLRVCNIYDFLLRKVVAPRMTTQADMNVFYQGVEVSWHYVQLLEVLAALCMLLYITCAAQNIMYCSIHIRTTYRNDLFGTDIGITAVRAVNLTRAY
jgi:hypothetical protein